MTVAPSKKYICRTFRISLMKKLTKTSLTRLMTDTLKARAEYKPEQDALIFAAVSNSIMMVEAQKVIDDQGLLITGQKGDLIKNPACMIKRQAEQSMFTAFKALKLDPASLPNMFSEGESSIDALMREAGLLDDC